MTKYFFFGRLLFAILLLTAIGTFTTSPIFAASHETSILEDIPEEPCLDVTSSNATGKKLVSLTNPTGNGTRFELTLYVINLCNGTVTNPTVGAYITGSCPSGSTLSSGHVVSYTNPYPIAKMAGFGRTWIVTVSCIRYQNGQAVSQVPPTTIWAEIDTAGPYGSKTAVAPGVTLYI